MYRSDLILKSARLAASKPDAAYVRVPRNNFIDEHVFAKLQKLNIKPAEVAGDGEFLRRVYLDAIGKLPTEEEARAFLASKFPDKRAAIIDWLLEQPGCADVWAGFLWCCHRRRRRLNPESMPTMTATNIFGCPAVMEKPICLT